MENGYFQLVAMPGGYGIRIIAPKKDGERVRLTELMNYLDRNRVDYDMSLLKKAVNADMDESLFLSRQECPRVDESYQLEISSDGMEAVARFYPPSSTGARITFADIYREMKGKGISTGVQMQNLQEHFQSEGRYCTDTLVAKGRAPRHGTDARIEYFFNTDIHVRPTEREDGTVDFYQLNVINHCHKGDVLARMIPADEGEYGQDIYGNRIKPRDVKRLNLKYGNNIDISEDRLTITSRVDGHVMLVEDKVFVSDVYEVENVDVSTGNVEFEGSVHINGNVASNFCVQAKGNVEINGVVEGARIIAGGNIIIARGMSGMNKGSLKAGGNIVAKFMENLKAEAGGYINSESILHSDVIAGTEIVVSGKKGLLTGGHIQAGSKVIVKTLGANLGALTVVEVGISPQAKAEYQKLQKEVSELVKEIRNLQPIVENYLQRKANGAKMNPSQQMYAKNAARQMEEYKTILIQKNESMKELQQSFRPDKKACVEVQGAVYPGTTIIINDVSMTVQSIYRYCRFERVDADVKANPL